jgi:hypothetical protein
MPRRPRIEFEGATYHVMARSNARQKIVRDDGDRRRLIDGLERSVVRHGSELLCYVVMGIISISCSRPRARTSERGCRAFTIGIRRLCGAGLGQSAPTTVSRRLAFGGWVLGSERFAARLRSLAGSIQSDPPVAEARQLIGIDPKRIFAAVRSFYGLDDAALSRRHDPHVARGVAAWLCRRHTEASLRELAVWRAKQS